MHARLHMPHLQFVLIFSMLREHFKELGSFLRLERPNFRDGMGQTASVVSSAAHVSFYRRRTVKYLVGLVILATNLVVLRSMEPEKSNHTCCRESRGPTGPVYSASC
jgi:hypothetical protein